VALNQRNPNIQLNPDENRIQTEIPVANQLLSILYIEMHYKQSLTCMNGTPRVTLISDYPYTCQSQPHMGLINYDVYNNYENMCPTLTSISTQSCNKILQRVIQFGIIT